MKQQIFRLLADLRFSILLLLLISFCSLLGTIIEQDQPIEVYKSNYPLDSAILGFFSWNFIIRFGLDHVYQTWWFFNLIFLFGLSLSLCSFFQQLPSLKIARRCQFLRTTGQFYKLKMSTVLPSFLLMSILYKVQKRQYTIFHQKKILYCYKGLIGRLAPIIVHFSMILVLIGAVFGSLFGFKAQEIVPKAEIFHIQNTLMNGPLSIIPQTSGRINDFWITYTKQKTVAQFYSDLSLLDQGGKEITRQTISVNLPLIHDKLYYYQTDWSLLGLRFQTANSDITEFPLVNLTKSDTKVWLSWINIFSGSNNGMILIIDNLQGYCSIYDKDGLFLKNIELNELINVNQSITLIDILSATGLQIKLDPGLPIIYCGFLFLMISVLISYITYSQIWLVQKKNQLFVGGNTNRAVFEFELEFFKFIN